MKLIKTKIGDLYYNVDKTQKPISYQILDSNKQLLWSNPDKDLILTQLGIFQYQNQTLQEWLETLDDVCWAESEEEVVDIAKEYYLSQDWAEEDIQASINNLNKNYKNNLNKVGDTYILWNYGEF